MKSNIKLLILVLLSLTVSSCRDLFQEDCNYLSYIKADIQCDSLLSTVPKSDFIMEAYTNVFTPLAFPFSEQGSAMGAVYTGGERNGTVSLLFYNPKDYILVNAGSYSGIWARVDTVYSEKFDAMVIKTPSAHIGRAAEVVESVTEDTVYVKPFIESMTQSLRVRINVFNSVLFRDFTVQESVLGGHAVGKRIIDGRIEGGYYPALLNFRKEGSDESISHGKPEEWEFGEYPSSYDGLSYVADLVTFGTKGAGKNVLSLSLSYGQETEIHDIDLTDALNSWSSPFREIIINVRLGEPLDKLDIELHGWYDLSEIPILVLPDIK